MWCTSTSVRRRSVLCRFYRSLGGPLSGPCPRGSIENSSFVGTTVWYENQRIRGFDTLRFKDTNSVGQTSRHNVVGSFTYVRDDRTVQLLLSQSGYTIPAVRLLIGDRHSLTQSVNDFLTLEKGAFRPNKGGPLLYFGQSLRFENRVFGKTNFSFIG